LRLLAGRPQLRDDITSLLSGLSRRELLLSMFSGRLWEPGKLISLYYLANRASELAGRQYRTSPYLTEFPREPRILGSLPVGHDWP